MEQREINVDLIVVGSGIAGSAAALQASRAGARVALLEKSADFGGSAALSAGMYWTAPSVEAYQRRIPQGDVRLGAHIVEQFQAGLALLRELGITVAGEATENIMTFGVGYSFDVRGFLDRAREEVRRAGGRCDAGTGVTGLLSDDARTITGATARRGTQPLTYRAPAVVLASGGFQGAREELRRHIPQADTLVFRSNPGSTGDGLDMVRRLGIREVGAMNSFYGHLLPWPLERFGPADYLPYSQYYSESTVLLNLEGRRFLDERSGDEILNQAIVDQPQARGVMIFDDHVRRTEATSEPFPGLGLLDRFEVARAAGGLVAEAPTLEELYGRLAEWGLDPEQVTATMREYAIAAATGGGEAGGAPVSAGARAPQDGPFYAVMVQPSITFTFGGVPIDPQGHVLDNDGHPVTGLYAAGADVGGISATGYAGGLAPAFLTGTTAGRTAVAETRLQPAHTR